MNSLTKTCLTPFITSTRRYSSLAPKEIESIKKRYDYFRCTAIGGAALGTVLGCLCGKWYGEIKNEISAEKDSFTPEKKKWNVITSAAIGAACGLPVGILAGPSVLPILVLCGIYTQVNSKTDS